MYPIGFLSLLKYLQQHGYRVRIINVAVKMLRDPKFNVEKLVESLHPMVFGIDLHWFVHAQGCLELAKIVKHHHPDTPIVLGGLTSTYYHREIIANHPQVDCIVRGDSAEEPLLQLVRCVERGEDFNRVPNLTWKNSNGKIKVNPLTYVPTDLRDFSIDYEALIKSAIKHGDLNGYLPALNWLEHPIAALVCYKGCTFNCIFCGGSRYAYRKVCNRTKVAPKSPPQLVDEMATIERHFSGPVYLVGDIFALGEGYASSLLSRMKSGGFDNLIVFELFSPWPKSALRKVSEACPNFGLSISPESHDESIRHACGRAYGNDELRKTVSTAIKLGCKRFDLFFSIGLPNQTKASVLDDVRFCRELLEKYGKEGTLRAFVSPILVDPGSMVFDHPQKFGYALFFKSLRDYGQMFDSLSWKYFLNYQTTWMSRDDIVDVTLKTACLMVETKVKCGLMNLDEAFTTLQKIELARIVLSEIDRVLKATGEQREKWLRRLEERIKDFGDELLCLKKELLEWPIKSNIKRMEILKSLIKTW
jgi:B12-binding domain/radical SAM domain protein